MRIIASFSSSRIAEVVEVAGVIGAGGALFLRPTWFGNRSTP